MSKCHLDEGLHGLRYCPTIVLSIVAMAGCRSSEKSTEEVPQFPSPYVLDVDSPPEAKFDLGDGFDIITGGKKPSPFASQTMPRTDLKTLHGEGGSIDCKLVLSTEEVFSALSLNAGADVSFLGWGSSSKLAVAKEARTHALAKTYVLSARFLSKEAAVDTASIAGLRLTEDAQKILSNGGYDAFRREYGDGFVGRIVYGAEAFGVYSIEGTDSEKISKIDSDIQVQAPVVGGGRLSIEKAGTVANHRATDHYKADYRGPQVASSPRSANELEVLVQQIPTIIRNYPDNTAIMKLQVYDYAYLPGFNVEPGSIVDALDSSKRLLKERLRVRDVRDAWEYASKHAGQLGMSAEDCGIQVKRCTARLGDLDGTIKKLASAPREPAVQAAAQQQLDDPDLRAPRFARLLRGPIVRPIAHFPTWKHLSGRNSDNDLHTKDGRRTDAHVQVTISKITATEIKYAAQFHVYEHEGDRTKIGDTVTGTLLPDDGYRFVVPDDVSEICPQGPVDDYTLKERSSGTARTKQIDVNKLRNSAFTQLDITYDSTRSDDRAYVGFSGTIRLKIDQLAVGGSD